jgi:hypothetical protein
VKLPYSYPPWSSCILSVLICTAPSSLVSPSYSFLPPRHLNRRCTSIWSCPFFIQLTTWVISALSGFKCISAVTDIQEAGSKKTSKSTAYWKFFWQ